MISQFWLPSTVFWRITTAAVGDIYLPWFPCIVNIDIGQLFYKGCRFAENFRQSIIGTLQKTKTKQKHSKTYKSSFKAVSAVIK